MIDLSSQTLLTEAARGADEVEKINAADGSYIMYLGFFTNGDPTKCQIKKVEYTLSAAAAPNTELWVTTWPDGQTKFNKNWSQRAAYTYKNRL